MDDPTPENLSGYAAVIRATMNTIGARSANFKRLVVSYALVGVTTLLSTVTLGSTWLQGLLVLPLFLGIFLFLDQRLVNGWRTAVLNEWTIREVNFGLLSETLKSIPGLPGNTLQGLLVSLPALAAKDDEIPAKMREALALTQTLIGAVQVRRMAIYAAAYGIGALGLVVVVMGSLSSLLVLLAATVLAGFLERFRTVRRLQHHCDVIQGLCSEGLLDQTAYAEFAQALDWSGMPAKDKDHWLGRFEELGTGL